MKLALDALALEVLGYFARAGADAKRKTSAY
jgi:hypothetical protein